MENLEDMNRRVLRETGRRLVQTKNGVRPNIFINGRGMQRFTFKRQTVINKITEELNEIIKPKTISAVFINEDFERPGELFSFQFCIDKLGKV